MKPVLGCIADDFTGASDLGSMLQESGMSVIQFLGVPGVYDDTIQTEAIVVALKTRSNPKEEAISESLEALRWLQQLGCQHFYFKYCSTFDSTEEGNIGPVTEALMRELKTGFTIACPAYPENGRTVFKGHLFVGDTLLSESGMENHPLNPMTDSNLVRFLQHQTSLKVGLLGYSEIAGGGDSVEKARKNLEEKGVRIAIADATTNADLVALAEGCGNLRLLTGGSGLALGLPQYYRKKGLITEDGRATTIRAMGGHEAVIAGSCSRMTLRQVDEMKRSYRAIQIDPAKLGETEYLPGLIDGLEETLKEGRLLIYSSADPESVSALQRKLGRNKAGERVENALATIAVALVEKGVTKLVVAGGETSGAVLKGLKITGLNIGQAIAPGVPWTRSINEPSICLALKSGNFGSENFFADAFEKLGE